MIILYFFFILDGGCYFKAKVMDVSQVCVHFTPYGDSVIDEKGDKFYVR